MKAYSYLRISTPEQRAGDGVRRQLQQTREYCEARGLFLDDAPIADLGRSGFHGHNLARGALGHFLHAVQSGVIETPCALIVENLDRVSRQQIEEAVYTLLSIVRAGVEVHTTLDRNVYRSGEIDMTKMLISVVSLARGHEESFVKSRRLSAVWEKKRQVARETKAPVTRLLPEWLALDDDGKSIHPIPERVEIIRRIFREAADGRGRYVIADALNAEGVETWGRGKKKGVRWHYSYVTKILHSRAVLGELQLCRMEGDVRVPDGDPIVGMYPPVITVAEWKAAHTSLLSRQTKHNANPEAPRNLMSGLVHINGVKAAWYNKGRRTTSGGKRGTKKPHPMGGYWVYYQSLDAKTGKTLDQIPAPPIEAMILAALTRMDGDQWMALIKQAPKVVSASSAHRSRLETERRRHRSSLERLTEALALGMGATATLTAKLAEIERLLHAVEQELSTLPSDADATIKDFGTGVREIRKLAKVGDCMKPEIRSALSRRLCALFNRVDIGRTYRSLMAERDDNTAILFPRDADDLPVADGLDDPALMWALLTPRAAKGCRILVCSHAPHPAVKAALQLRAGTIRR